MKQKVVTIDAAMLIEFKIATFSMKEKDLPSRLEYRLMSPFLLCESLFLVLLKYPIFSNHSAGSPLNICLGQNALFLLYKAQEALSRTTGYVPQKNCSESTLAKYLPKSTSTPYCTEFLRLSIFAAYARDSTQY